MNAAQTNIEDREHVLGMKRLKTVLGKLRHKLAPQQNLTENTTNLLPPPHGCQTVLRDESCCSTVECSQLSPDSIYTVWQKKEMERDNSCELIIYKY